ncbi:MAG: tryptophan synthase subunit alpha [Actinomycetota bacterium]|nr:tryptophan synthase subunit alpha [Actinomycetota bacterium]
MSAGEGLGLEASLRRRREAGAKLLVPYVMGGMTPDWVDIAHAAVAAGADALEVGLPFSDPMMDGPVIQEAALAALRRGSSAGKILDELAGASLGIPIVVMSYYNIVFRTGLRRMAGSLAAAGVAGALLPDVPLEELGPWAEEADRSGLDTVLMVALTTPAGRAQQICSRARGFVYAVARMGVTGERNVLGDEVVQVVDRVRAVSDLPVCAGIGVSTPEQAAQACRSADGVIIGSALVRRALGDHGVEAAASFLGEVRAALDAT